MKIRLFIYLVILIFSSLSIWYFNPNYSYSDVKDYLGFLGVVSSMIFTIMGIWIAFLYPNALKRIVDWDGNIKNVDFSESQLESKRLEGIVASILSSGFVVVVSMLIFFLKLVFHSSEFYLRNVDWIKPVVLSIITSITLIQFVSVFSVIFSNIMFLNDLYEKKVNRSLDNDLGGN